MLEKPKVYDLYCSIDLLYLTDGNQREKGRMGKSILSEEALWIAATWTWRQPQKAWTQPISRAPFVAFDDDQMRMVGPESGRLSPLPRKRDYSVPEMAGVHFFSGRHGTEADAEAYA